MSKKTLGLLVALLAALAGAMWMNQREASVSAIKGSVAGGTLLPSVDMNTVRSITIEDGTATTHLAKVEGSWCVAEQGQYPADFSRLREMMRSIDGTIQPTKKAPSGRLFHASRAGRGLTPS